VSRIGLFFDLAKLGGDLRVEIRQAALSDRLVEMALISLFSWRRAESGDEPPGGDYKGWWGDTLPAVPGDKFGSRLWLLARRKIVPATLTEARDYALEALDWMRQRGLATRLDVTADRVDLEGIALTIEITDADGALLRFAASLPWENSL